MNKREESKYMNRNNRIKMKQKEKVEETQQIYEKKIETRKNMEKKERKKSEGK